MNSSWDIFDFLLAPISFGGPAQGAEQGPFALAERLGITKERMWASPSYSRGDYKNGSPEILSAFKNFSGVFSERVFSSLTKKKFPVVIGGDHSLSIGTLTGLMKYLTAQHDENVGIIWIDAHTDIHTPSSSSSGNIHGMPLGAACRDEDGYLESFRENCPKKFPYSSLCYIGVRDIDPEEAEVLKQHNIWHRSSKDIHASGAHAVTEEAVAYLKSQNLNRVHISFDIDVLDPSYAQATATPVPQGITAEDAHTIVDILITKLEPIVFEFVELNPPCDTERASEKLLAELATSTLNTIARRYQG